MELAMLIQMLIRRWWIILLPVIFAFLLLVPSLPDTLSPSPTYNVTMRFTAAAPANADPDAIDSYEDDAYVPWLASEYVVVNLPQWVTGDTFAESVSQNLATQDIEISAEDVRGAFAADSARSILVVFVTWDDPDEAQVIAEAAIDVLQTENQQIFPQFAAVPAEVVPLDNVRVNTVPIGIMTRLDPFIRLAIALAAGVGLAIAVEFLDRRIHTPQELQALELPIYGVVPSE